MDDIKKRVYEVLHNLNWLMEPHDSFVELVEVRDRRVIVRCVGYCAQCESDCVRVAFKERMPDIELIIRQ
jgi:hypothetical protein